jgi:hypothetical protein
VPYRQSSVSIISVVAAEPGDRRPLRRRPVPVGFDVVRRSTTAGLLAPSLRSRAGLSSVPLRIRYAIGTGTLPETISA